MSFVNFDHTLAAALATSGTVNVDYPEGFSRGDFLGAYAHHLVAGQEVYDAPNDFTVTLNAGNFTITWKASNTLAAGTTLGIQLDRPGTDSGRQLFDGTEIPGAVEVRSLHIALGSPVAADADGLVASVSPAAGGYLTLLTNDLDVPRNVTVTSTANDTARTFTVTGKDVHGQDVVEEIAGANAAAAAGKKAFSSISSIAVDAATAGSITVGWGNVLGLPVFVDKTSDVQRFEDGVEVATGTLTAADTDTPTATTGDVRGTWAPNTAPNGNVAYTVEVDTTDPGYLGATNYAG